ncbi:Rha family transcriptional regulator [Oxalobacter vibrioformis]|uniref:Rha family transcriptional regulator n=1 Tax=Oxalobacter vibrioformis TaxID=933080 RepID=A0A9E9P1X4_9BURK|nr:Rha family transcriptional regulator [Oxalobacter vibrioformis]WAW09284.1 Rha family transcriptional regulator [Oxalobacter vibrioformis]
MNALAIQNEKLVSVNNQEPVTTSLIVAEKFNKRHDHVLRAIQNLECSDGFRLLNFGESSYRNEQNKKQPMYHITRDGFMFLAMGFTGKKAARWKECFIDAFRKMGATLVMRSSSEWNAARIENKTGRRVLTDAIQYVLIPYAISQGSRNHGMMFVSYTRLVQSCTSSDKRDSLPAHVLAKISVLEVSAATEILKLVARNVHYREIYQAVKSEINEIVRLWNALPIANANIKQLEAA